MSHWGATGLRFLVIVAALTTSGCQKKMKVEEHRAWAAVREYNLVLPRAYRGRDPKALAGVATDNEISRIWTLVLGLSQRDMVLDSRQERQERVSVTADEDKAEVVTKEAWWFRHVDIKTRAVRQAPKRVSYQIRYRLVRKEGRWLVNRLEMIESHEEAAK